MNLPNRLTVMRMALIPFFLIFMLCDGIPHRYLIAAAIFGAASFTDYLDGHIARRDGLVTNFGKLMDPLADKLLVFSALICHPCAGVSGHFGTADRCRTGQGDRCRSVRQAQNSLADCLGALRAPFDVGGF